MLAGGEAARGASGLPLPEPCSDVDYLVQLQHVLALELMLVLVLHGMHSMSQMLHAQNRERYKAHRMALNSITEAS